MNATSLSWKAALRRWVLKHVEQAPLRFHFCARASHGKKCHGDKKFPEVQSVSSTGTVLSVLFFTLQGVNPASSEVSGRLCALMIIEVMLKHLQKESTVQYALPWLIHMVNHALFPNLCYYPRKCLNNPFRIEYWWVFLQFANRMHALDLHFSCSEVSLLQLRVSSETYLLTFLSHCRVVTVGAG